MTQKIIKIGSSQGITLSKQALSSAGLKNGDDVRVEYNPHKKCIEVSGVVSSQDQKHLADALTIIEQHKAELQKTHE